MALEPGDRPGVRAKRFGLGARRRNDHDFVAFGTQGADHFFDVDVLAVLGTGAVMVKDFHAAFLAMMEWNRSIWPWVVGCQPKFSA
jgi:hypothetical protein